MPHPQTGQKGCAGLLQCPKILLTCFRARISAGGDERGSTGPDVAVAAADTGGTAAADEDGTADNEK